MVSLGESARLYNGSEYVYTNHGYSGHPFFDSAGPLTGEVYYDGTRYTRVPISYDIVRDEVMIANTGQGFDLRLVPNKISYFIIDGHRFIRLDRDSSNKRSPPGGFYDLLYQGKVQVLAKRYKTSQEALKADESYTFAQYSQYYVLKQHTYYRIDSRNSLYNAFADEKEAVRKNFRHGKLNYKRRPEEAIVKTAEFCDR
jgi:hypothetical protein